MKKYPVYKLKSEYGRGYYKKVGTVDNLVILLPYHQFQYPLNRMITKEDFDECLTFVDEGEAENESM
jgi:hypothetical protein